MRIATISGVFLGCVYIFLLSGCSSELKDLRFQNEIQQKRIDTLQAELAANKLELDQLKRQLDGARQKGGIEVETLEQKITALEESIAKKDELIASMQDRLLSGGAQLPVELTTKLEDFAKEYEMVTYDPNRGIVKFKSDLLFKSGSDEVLPAAVSAVKSLCDILNSEQGIKFHIIVAGHTDDQPIRYSRAKHPTNWHLSAHRAISVLNVMAENSIDSERLSVRGFGEYRPSVPNEPDKKGNPQNRRVEIYIVPEGA